MGYLDQYKSRTGPTVGEAWRLAEDYEQLQARIGADNATRAAYHTEGTP